MIPQFKPSLKPIKRKNSIADKFLPSKEFQNFIINKFHKYSPAR